MLQHSEGRSVLTMPRDDWNRVMGLQGVPVVFDVRSTPLAGISRVSSVVAAVADRFGPTTTRVSIYRHDPADTRYPINQDEYYVWTDLSAHPRFKDIITAASTEDNENLRAYCRENVFLVKQGPGPDHWLSTLPASISALLKST
jgi:hypothetical protein